MKTLTPAVIDAADVSKFLKGRKGRTTHKYHVAPVADRTDSDGKVHASKLEKNVTGWLAELAPGVSVRTQVKFELLAPERDWITGTVMRGIYYVADFVIGPVREAGGGVRPLPGCMVLDAKGMKVPVFSMKEKIFRRVFGLPITNVKSKKALAAALKLFAAFQAMNEFIKARAEDHKPFIVRGYVASDGSTSDKKVRIIGRAGYLALVRESRDMLALKSEPKGFTQRQATLWHEAKAALLDAYARRLGEAESTAGPRVSHETLVPVVDSVALLDGDPTKVVVFSLLSEDLVEPRPPAKETVTAYKSALESALPIGGFCFRLNLYEGKYTALEPV